jgi:hypothetical protein
VTVSWQQAGRAWGGRALDWAFLTEAYGRPAYELVFARTGLGQDTSLLDIACGPGLALMTAAGREPRSQRHDGAGYPLPLPGLQHRHAGGRNSTRDRRPTSGMNSQRAGCVETRTSGSEGGAGKPPTERSKGVLFPTLPAKCAINRAVSP